MRLNLLVTMLCVFVVVPTTWADPLMNGAMVVTKSCASSPLVSLDSLCKLVDLTNAGCKTTADSCGRGTRELFAGTDIEIANPANMKPWNGFGGHGFKYGSAALCLMRGLEKFPSRQLHNKVTGGVLEVSAETELGMIGFDPKKARWKGYHRLKACGPVVGCLDVLTQKFELTGVSEDLNGKGYQAGSYAIRQSFATSVSADGLAQGFETKFPSISVPTPAGPINVQPEFRVGRAVGLIGSPFNGNAQTSNPTSLFPATENRTYDSYGRIGGAKASTRSPIDAALNDVDWKYSQKAWMSALALGGRDPVIKHDVWKPEPKTEFPAGRPDLALNQARSDLEKTPNGYLGASANVSYGITKFLPESLRDRLTCSGSVSLCLKEADVFAKPSIDMAFSSQVNFVQNEQSFWKMTKTQSEFPLPIVTPDTFDQFHGLDIQTASTVSGMTSLETGLNFLIKLEIDTKFTTIKKNLINIHPRVTIPLLTDSQMSEVKVARTRTIASQALKEGRVFQEYRTWEGVDLAKVGKDGGLDSILECAKTPPPKEVDPSPPSYSKGDPNDLAEFIEFPCNICVSWDDIQYKDDEDKEQTVEGGAWTVFPTAQTGIPTNQKWKCVNPSQLGCYDLCQLKDGKRVVTHGAQTLIAIGYDAELPKTCVSENSLFKAQ